MATEKQLAALAKARAARKKKTKAKPVAKKRVKKIAVNAPSRATGKKPSPRLKARRQKNKTAPKGYYPNPSVREYVIVVETSGPKGQIGYFSTWKEKGPAMDDDYRNAAKMTKESAENICSAIKVVAGRAIKQCFVSSATEKK